MRMPEGPSQTGSGEILDQQGNIVGETPYSARTGFPQRTAEEVIAGVASLTDHELDTISAEADQIAKNRRELATDQIPAQGLRRMFDLGYSFLRHKTTRLTGTALLATACTVSANPNPDPQTFVPQSPPPIVETFKPTEPPTKAPTPIITSSPSPDVTPKPTLPIVEGLTPEQVRDLQDWLDRKTPIPVKFNSDSGQVRFGLLTETPNSSRHDQIYTGQILGTKELSAGNAIIYIGMEDNSGNRFFIPFEAKNKSSVAYDTLSSLLPTANNGDLTFIEYPEYYNRFDEVFKGKIASIILPVDSFPDYEPWTQLYNFAKEAQVGNINDISNLPSFVSDMGVTEGPAIGQINIYTPPSN